MVEAELTVMRMCDLQERIKDAAIAHLKEGFLFDVTSECIRLRLFFFTASDHSIHPSVCRQNKTNL